MRLLANVRIYFSLSCTEYLPVSSALTEAQVRKEFAEDEERRLAAGEELPHETTPAAFIFLGLELEDMQCVLQMVP